jgi:hypothetical protein
MLLGFFSPGDASVIVAVIVAIAGAIAQRNRRDIKMINRAVNHQGLDHPTLIQRVIRLEANQTIHTTWTAEALVAVAGQIGVTLPDLPKSLTEYESLDPPVL